MSGNAAVAVAGATVKILAVGNRDYGRSGSAALTLRHPSIRKSWH
jgi:hypothetical protein